MDTPESYTPQTGMTHRVTFGWGAYQDFDNHTGALAFYTALLASPTHDPALAQVSLLDLSDPDPRWGYRTLQYGEREVRR